MTRITFPYQNYHGYLCPIIPIEIKGPAETLITEVYVDSGASYTILSANVALGIGVDYKSVRPSFVTVGNGDKIAVYFHHLAVRIESISFRTVIGFSDQLKIGFNILGRKGFFTRFDITFSDSSRTITMNPR